VPEVMDDGLTGFVVHETEQAVRAVERVPSLSRAECRQVFERRFSVRRMARDYVAVYRRLLEEGGPRQNGRRGPGTGAVSGNSQADGYRTRSRRLGVGGA